MFKHQDPYTYTQFLTLYDYSSGMAQAIGVLAVEYRATLYNDVQVQDQSSVNQPQNQQFLLFCTQRLFLANTSNSSVAPITGSQIATEYFANYPALLQTYMQIAQAKGVTLNLMDYSPLTVNTAVQQSSSSADTSGSTTGSSSSSTTGSSYTQSSTYGTSVTVGDTFSGASASYEYSASQTNEKSQTAGSEASTSAGRERSLSAAMSIKDWGSYASVNPIYAFPTWVFGQEYPWNAIDCRYAGSATYPGVKDANGKVLSEPNANQFLLNISNSMAADLCNDTFLYPPSELSMFGVNFVMKASWRVFIDYSTSTTVTLNHNIRYFCASHIALQHNLDGENAYVPQVYLDQTPATLSSSGTKNTTPTFNISIDLNVMGLDPLGVNAPSAIVGFLPAKFIPPATITPTVSSATLPLAFKTISATNDLMIENATQYGSLTCSGFTVSQASLTAGWSETKNISYILMLYFKVTDSVSEYSLNIKHWVTGQTGVKLSFVINNDTSNTITKYVTALEGEGGDNNLLTIALRNLDFASIDYHDCLQLGLNAIAITIEPIDDAWAGCCYQIRAMSIT
jgi:hypothetical protein